MNISIYSRKAAEEIMNGNFPENTAVISFYDPQDSFQDEDYEALDYSDYAERDFYVEIHDIDLSVLPKYGLTYETFFPEADELAEFIYEAYEDGLDIICQCEHGESRSAACAAAILEHFYKSGISVFADYRYYPNQVVYHKVYDALEKYKAAKKG